VNTVEPNVILHGGPASLPLADRIQYVENTDEKVKLPMGNRYEHFEPTCEMERHFERDLRILVWTGCTYVAE
jgi:hypothetical protein